MLWKQSAKALESAEEAAPSAARAGRRRGLDDDGGPDIFVKRVLSRHGAGRG
jgi:hypothetical protein